MIKRIHLSLSRKDAAILYGILNQAIDESTGNEDGMLVGEDYDCAARIAVRLWNSLQRPPKFKVNIFQLT